VGNPVLIGQYDYTLDDKNRLVVPPRFRELLNQAKENTFVLAKGIDDCLWLFLPSQWESFMTEFKDAVKNMKDKGAARAAQREMFRSAEEVKVDEQGRVHLSDTLKGYARLKKDVVVAGAGSKAEVWDSERYRQYMDKQAKPAFAKIAKELPF
jgi:MraZ protein